MNVIITGASKGIGKGIAQVLGRSGHGVGLIARSAELLEELKTEINNGGGSAFAATADLRRYDETERAIASLVESLGGVDALINNAGLITKKSALEISVAEWQAMIETNLNGVFYATRAVADRLIKQDRGHIINVSSISGKLPLKGGSGYAASKYAVAGFSESLFLELREYGVKVTTIYPGSVDSESHREGDASWKVTPQEVGETCRHVLETSPQNCIRDLEIRPLRKPS